MQANVRQFEYRDHWGNPSTIRVIKPSKIATFTLLGSCIAPLALFAVILIVGWITPGYDPIRDTISQMGTVNNPYAEWLNGSYVIYGALIALSTLGFYNWLKNGRHAKLFGLLLGLHALGTMLLAVFPDAPNMAGVIESKFNSHNLVSAIAYLPLIGASLLFYLMNRRSVNLKGIFLLGLAVIAVNVPMPMINIIDALEPIAGLLQRSFYAVTCYWLSVASWRTYRLQSQKKQFQFTQGVGL